MLHRHTMYCHKKKTGDSPLSARNIKNWVRSILRQKKNIKIADAVFLEL